MALKVNREEVERFVDALSEARDDAHNWLNSGEADTAIASALYVAADDAVAAGRELMAAVARWEKAAGLVLVEMD